MKGIFLLLLALVNGQTAQPDRWPKINAKQYQYSATKSFFFDDKGHGESQFIQFYSQYDEFTQNNWQVMSVRKDGIYTTAYWDRINQKAHFAYDKYSCDSVLLPNPPAEKNEPLEWMNPKTGSVYSFFPDIVAIENEEMTTDPQIVNDLNGIVVRGRPAWKWTAKMHLQGDKDQTKEYDVAVYYSIPTEDESSISVPVRFEFDGGDGFRLVNEIFNFRIDEIPAEIFLLPELAPCKTSHSPTIPAMTANFHAKIEVCDRIGYEHIVPIYNLNIHYNDDLKLSTYKFPSKGIPFLVDYFGDTDLTQVTDFDSQLIFVMDEIWGNCSIFSIDPAEWDYPASDIWVHGGTASMRDPKWFWQIPNPEAYWYKGETSTRSIGSHRWAIHHESHSLQDIPDMVFEWEFANESYVFFEGEDPDQKKVALQPLLLKTRKTNPEPNGHHLHNDFSIYFYSNSEKQNPVEIFDVSKCYFGAHHEFIQFNVTDIDGQANNVLQRFYEEFKLKLVSQLSVAAGVSFIRISRLHTIGLGLNDEFFIQFNILDKYPHSKAQEQTNLKQAVENLQAKADMGAIVVEMDQYLGVTSRFKIVPHSLSGKEYIDYNVEYKTKTVVDGHTSGSFAAVTISSIIVGILLGLVSVSAVFQIPIMGITVPRPC